MSAPDERPRYSQEAVLGSGPWRRVAGLAALHFAAGAFESLDAPIGRVGSTFTPVGFNRVLERAILPNTEKVLVGLELRPRPDGIGETPTRPLALSPMALR